MSEEEKMRKIECMMWLIDIEEGKPVTERQYTAIRFFLGDLIDKVKAIPMKSISLHFDGNGEAFSIDDEGLFESVNGKPVKRPVEHE